MRTLLLLLLLLVSWSVSLAEGQERTPLSASLYSPSAYLLSADSLRSSGDSVFAPTLEHDLSKRAEKIAQQTLWKPNSSKALLWALLPGGGQIYNRKYWKLPIVWGAFTACYYAISFNNRQYQDYHAAYRDLSSADPQTNTAWLAFAPQGAQASDYEQYVSSLRPTLKRGNDFYRRYRDLSILATVLVYGLSVLDAYVDAELYTFDISPDLALRVVPEVGLRRVGSPSYPAGAGLPSYQVGVNCSLTF